MPKRRDPDRPSPPRKDEPAVSPPDQAEVERAIRSIVEKLKPKPPKGRKTDKPESGSRRSAPP